MGRASLPPSLVLFRSVSLSLALTLYLPIYLSSFYPSVNPPPNHLQLYENQLHSYFFLTITTNVHIGGGGGGMPLLHMPESRFRVALPIGASQGREERRGLGPEAPRGWDAAALLYSLRRIEISIHHSWIDKTYRFVSWIDKKAINPPMVN